MYKRDNQMRIEDFVFPYGKLNPENEWVKLAALVPWDTAEERYAAQFEHNGHPAHPARVALGALLIKQRLKCSDEWVVRHVSENPYLQYFLGMKEYSDACPFGASTMVAFRKRFSEEDITAILEASIPKKDKKLETMMTTSPAAGRSSWMPPAAQPTLLTRKTLSCSTAPGRKQRRSSASCARTTISQCRGPTGGRRGRIT